jgi:ribonuclease VapC
VASQEIVIDASAALAYLRKEIGGELAEPFLASGIMSAVNYAEVVQRFWRSGEDPQQYLYILERSGLKVVAPDMAVAKIAGDLERLTKSKGVSLGDRFCIAEAMQRNLPVLTTDRPWSDLALPIEVKRLR